MKLDDIDEGDVLWMTDLARGVTNAVTVVDVDSLVESVTVIDEDGQLWSVAPGFLTRR